MVLVIDSIFSINDLIFWASFSCPSRSSSPAILVRSVDRCSGTISIPLTNYSLSKEHWYIYLGVNLKELYNQILGIGIDR